MIEFEYDCNGFVKNHTGNVQAGSKSRVFIPRTIAGGLIFFLESMLDELVTGVLIQHQPSSYVELCFCNLSNIVTS
jgi:hypothetical protein